LYDPQQNLNILKSAFASNEEIFNMSEGNNRNIMKTSDKLTDGMKKQFIHSQERN
jgi:hypothetical protein